MKVIKALPINTIVQRSFPAIAKLDPIIISRTLDIKKIASTVSFDLNQLVLLNPIFFISYLGVDLQPQIFRRIFLPLQIRRTQPSLLSMQRE